MYYQDTCQLFDAITDNLLKVVFMGIIVVMAWKVARNIR